MVVLGGVEFECSEEFSRGCVDDPDVEVCDEENYVGSVVGSTDSDVVQTPVVAEGDLARVVDAVGANAVVDVGFC